MARILRLKKGVSPVFDEIGDLRKHRENKETEKFVEGVLRRQNEIPVSQFLQKHSTFTEEEVLDAAQRLPSVDVREIGTD